MSEQVAEAIRTAIRDHGPITFAEFMDLALYGPGGFYERPPVGPGGDFVTSPHVHPVFGAMLGDAVRDLFVALGVPTPLRIAEVGAGDGTLAARCSARSPTWTWTTRRSTSAPARATALVAIDGVTSSPSLDGRTARRRRQRASGQPAVPPGARRSRGPRRTRGRRLVEVETPWDGEPGPTSGETIVPWARSRSSTVWRGPSTRGYALLIDYGAVGSPGGDIHGYRDHRVVEDVLADPGSSDITAGVDFALIARHAEERGLWRSPR